ncbi:MAG: tRNA (cytidine(34)-2'-O)-methyltransferase [Clostridiales bacterium]|jgi:tRNA (cytidine/uridine-2'-O-)-methyltransferase|nr:tRNA (cytidine(34)-2'-O)-methyltransferase [Clostridiales bacterium]
MHIALLTPEIPHNAGAIGRTCAVTGTVLHLIKPLGFSLDEKYLNRSGMDYWHSIDLRLHNSFMDFLENFSQHSPSGILYYATTKAPRAYDSFAFAMGDCFVFGAESSGIPESILKDNLERCLRVPMREGSRSLNLSVSAGIILYEALRQNGFPALSGSGNFKS